MAKFAMLRAAPRVDQAVARHSQRVCAPGLHTPPPVTYMASQAHPILRRAHAIKGKKKIGTAT